ncbi:MAG: protein kinase family protein [Microcystis sp. M048S1]|uniref:protein kinase domain-containing protein n=1 Tax=unclassified Microcystis TaxID=2643300 RepID=UPI001190E6A5|nr:MULTISPECIES: AarF/UbiB family protein [unclassified Microcystis]MCA2900632.1 protein kinase family protein [Microcystis sp. M035S1]MCA2720489.1 protein kinase family protein [Microcystis sp. M176S2]MCA2725795.1 protein kinase family protein [Microcystis sp. M166S2]MCA2746068.1 protein kinase family protein [Microcystis sp. M155S2]MCA2769105.1 protein kinase family protein [Microcystis sp. M152S2]
MKYPLRTDYETFVKSPDKFIYDGILQKGKPVKQKQNQNFLLSHNGGKAVVYEIQTNPKKYALKCWIEDLGDLKIRYKAIDAYLKTVQLPYFVDFAYQEQGILVNGQRFPIIRMEWVDGISFKKFISNNINNPTSIRNFAEKFLEMVKILHQNNISHGDLQHGNIIVRKNGDLCLIDYDSLYVPQLSNATDNIKGLPGYQHPNRNKLSKLSPKADYFSEIVIYLSLLILSENPNYWQQIQQEERLLFSEKDLIKPNSSKIFKELKNLSPEIVYFTQELEKFCQQSNIENLQPLENLVNNYTGAKWSFEPTTDTGIQDPPPEKKPPQTSPEKTKSSDPWEKLKTNSSSAWDKFDTGKTPPPKDENIWDKFDTGKTPPPTDWDKLHQQPRKEAPVTIPDENIWDKFDNIWKKLTTSVSSIWNKILNWFN